MEYISKKDASLEVLLEDFTNHNIRKITKNPSTLSQKRAQALTVKMYSGEYGEYKGRKGEAPYLDESIKYDLRKYFPAFSVEQIDDTLIKLYSIYNES